jgi:hypothetical protein
VSKVFGIAVIIALVWIGLEIYTEGTGRAFGGALSRLGLVAPAPGGPATAPLDRIRAKATAARDQQLERLEPSSD